MATRVQQKQRTRQGIIDAAAELVAEGNTDPSVDQIAERAAMSRATVYRYFSTTSDIVWTAFADLSVAPAGEALAGIDDPAERVARVEQILNDYVFADTNSTRLFERALLERTIEGTTDPEDRPARRVRYIDAALEPLRGRIPEDRLDLLRNALTLAIGTQAVVALTDVCGLEPDRAREVTRFVTQALVHEALGHNDSDSGQSSS